MSILKTLGSLPLWLICIVFTLLIHFAIAFLFLNPSFIDKTPINKQGALAQGQQGIKIGLKNITPKPSLAASQNKKTEPKADLDKKLTKKETNKPKKTQIKQEQIPNTAEITALAKKKETTKALVKVPEKKPQATKKALEQTKTEKTAKQKPSKKESETENKRVKTNLNTAHQTSEKPANNSQAQENIPAAISTLGGGNPQQAITYQAILANYLEQNKRYPSKARKRKQQGIVTLFFKIDGDGNLLEYKIIEPSKYRALNRAVLMMIKTAAPLPAVPIDLRKNKQEFSYTLPIAFELKA